MSRHQRHPITPRHARAEMQHRLISNLDLEGTARLVRERAGTTDLRLIAAALGIRVVERDWRCVIDGIAMPGVVMLCSTDTEDEKQQALAHEIAHILLARRPCVHGDVWSLGLMLLRGLPLLERSNDGLTWAELLSALVDVSSVRGGENDHE